MITVDDLLVAHDHSSLNPVLQLPDVTRPVVRHEHVDGRRGNPADLLVVMLAVVIKEVFCKQEDIGLTFPKGGQIDWEDI